MEVLPGRAQLSGVTDPVDLIVAHGHRLKLHRVNSKDKLNNAFVTNNVEHDKKKSTSKLPRVVKPLSDTNNAFQCSRKFDNSGGAIVSTSKPTISTAKPRKPGTRFELERLKGSHIPRRKKYTTPVLKDNDNKMNGNHNYYSNKSQHIQRLQVPNIKPDFRQEDHTPTTSLGATRPIPTLGQIYRRNNIIIDGDRFYDWFMELDTPVNSLESNPRQRAMSTDSADTAQSVINVEVRKPQCFSNGERPKVVFGANTANVYKTTNDNISDWLTNEVDYSSKDNESGYRSMSPNSRGTISVDPKRSDAAVKQSDENYCLSLGKTSERFEAEIDTGNAEEENTDMVLTEQPTVVISRLNEENEIDPVHAVSGIKKIDIALEPIVICKSERSETLQFPSMTADSRDEKQALAPSYVECPSEVLQKTTNFEGDGCESPNTLSSIAGTDLEIRDDYSSLYTLENDDCNLEEHPGHANWCLRCRSQSCMTFVKSGDMDDITMQTSSCGCYRSNGTTAMSTGSDHVHREKKQYCRSCGRRASASRHGDSRVYCEKHSRYRRFPSYRYRITRPFDSLRKKLSIRRLCRHRWNRVWKKTAARWNSWSKSHSGLRKYRMLEYLQSSVIWEDVDVQTLLLVYRETGTHTNVMEQKSAGITASLKYGASLRKTDQDGVGTSARSFKSRFKQLNLGPSRFPFFYNSKRKSMPLQKMEEASKPLQKFNSYPANYHERNETIEFNKISEKMVSRDTSMLCGYMSAYTSPIDLNPEHRGCPCKDKDSSKVKKSKSRSNIVCECPPVKSDGSVKKLHKLRTVNTGTDDLTWIPLNDFNVTNPLFSTNVEMRLANDEIQNPLFVIDKTGTGKAFKPVIQSHSVGNDSYSLYFYKPCGINTDSVDMGSRKETSGQMKTSDSSDVNFSKLPKFSGSAVSSVLSSTAIENQPVPRSVLKSSSKLDGTARKDKDPGTENPFLKDTGSPATSSEDPLSLLESGTFKVPQTDKNTRKELAIGTSKPQLAKTGAKITSISSAEMLPASVVTSETDNRLHGAQNIQVNVSTTTKSMVCRCNDCRVASTGRSLTQVNKSTDAPIKKNEDKSIGPINEGKRVSFEQCTSTSSNESENKKAQNVSTEILVNQFSRNDFVDMGTVPATIGKKSTYVFATVDEKSAYAVTSKKKTQSFNMVTSNVNDIFNHKRSTVSTNTSHMTPKRSVGVSSPISLLKNDRKSTIDTWVQYSHINEQNDKTSLRLARIGHSRLITTKMLNDSVVYDTGTEAIVNPPSQYKTAAVMTSGPFDEASDTAELNHKHQTLLCTCAEVNCDMEINTRPETVKTKRHTACSTQVFQSHCNQTFDKATCSSEDYTQSPTINRKKRTGDQLTSLSRLTGQAKTGSQIVSNSTQPITSSILSSDLNAAKWINRCTHNDEKDYQSLLDMEQSTLETLKQASLSIANSSKSTRLPLKRLVKAESKIKPEALCNSVAIASPVPITTISDDSLADVLPANSVTQKTLPAPEITKMADKETSDEIVPKPLKETMLQTSPDTCDSGTDGIQPNVDYLKSASALTSRCILPSLSICCENEKDSPDCIFIYDKPHCAIHKTRFDASVQMTETDSEDKDTKPKSREHAIDQVDVDAFPCLEVPSCVPRIKSNHVIGEVLPPKAYKALYETTELVVKESRFHPVSNTVPCSPDIENEAAFIRALAIRSAAILTSQCGLCPTEREKNDSATDRAEYVYAFNSSHPSPEGSTQTCSNCHARLLDLPTYYQSGVVEERMKTQLVDSCRYYSNLLTKRLERVKERVTKHLAPPPQQCLYLSTLPLYAEAVTMKPSGRSELGCQTRRRHLVTPARRASCAALAPSATDICRGTDKAHLKSVYYMLSAIEGRIRRLKRNIPN